MKLKDLLVYITTHSRMRIFDRDDHLVIDGDIKDVYNTMPIEYYTYTVRQITTGTSAIIIELK